MKKRYPVKQDLNLAQREGTRKDLRAVLLTALALTAGISLFCAFAVVGRLEAVRQAEQAAAQSEQLLAQTMAATADYDQVMEEYHRYTMLHRALVSGADPLECLELVEGQLIDRSMVSGFVVGVDVISVQLAGVTLEQVSGIYTSLQAHPLVSGVQVYTAATGEDTGDLVEATMTIRLVTPEAVTDETGEVTQP